MPWTEYIWNPDNFTHGGPDFELGLLTILTGFCLLLTLLQIGKKNLHLIMALREGLAVLFRPRFFAKKPRTQDGWFLPPHASSLPGPMPARYSLPLQI